jgi:hypothetical protein
MADNFSGVSFAPTSDNAAGRQECRAGGRPAGHSGDLDGAAAHDWGAPGGAVVALDLAGLGRANVDSALLQTILQDAGTAGGHRWTEPAAAVADSAAGGPELPFAPSERSGDAVGDVAEDPTLPHIIFRRTRIRAQRRAPGNPFGPFRVGEGVPVPPREESRSNDAHRQAARIAATASAGFPIRNC